MTRLFMILTFFLLSSFSTRDQDIKALEEKIDKMEKQIMQKEVMSQGQMFEEWHQYAETLEQVEKEEHDLKRLKKQLVELKQTGEHD